MMQDARQPQRKAKAKERGRLFDQTIDDERAALPDDWERVDPATRMMPSFIIIGAQRGGTTSLFRTLEAHPAFGVPSRKEMHFFDRFYELGPRYYASHFPDRGSAQVTGEATPYYLFHDQAPARVRATLSEVKLIALLRDPVSRAYSQHQMMVRRGVETLPFEAAVEAEPARLAAAPDPNQPEHRYFSYLRRGHYAEQLARWYERFPREQVMVIRSEDFYREPNSVLHAVQAWLGLERWTPPQARAYNSRPYESLAPATRERLRSYFAPYNRQLAALLDRDMGW